MAGSLGRSNRGGPAVGVYWSAYLIGSVVLLVVLSLDPFFNKPSGWIKMELFTRKPVRHGFDPCSWDYEGSWKIGSFSGPSPTALNISANPLITCADVTSMSASFVRKPFLHIPGDGEQIDSSKWTVFYEMRNLRTYNSEIGASVSQDGGATWRHVGVALADRELSLSSPFVVYDAPSRLYIMLPDARPHASSYGTRGLQPYITTAEEFPLGWVPLPSGGGGGGGGGAAPAGAQAAARWMRRTDPDEEETRGSVESSSGRRGSGSGAVGSWGPPDRSGHFNGTTAVQYDGRWWIFTSLVRPAVLPWLSPRATPQIYTTAGGSSLLSPWTLHPASGRQPSVIAAAAAAAAAGDGGRRSPPAAAPAAAAGPLFSAGRPFVWQGAIHRWVHGCKSHCSDELTLLRASVANGTWYEEEAVATYLPGGDRSWHGRRVGHADVRPLPNSGGGEGERWWGVLSGDRYADGMHHFVVHELWFVELKASLRNLVAAQLALVLGVVALQAAAVRSERGGGKAAAGGDAADGDGGNEKGAGGGGWCCGPEAVVRVWAVQVLSRSPAGVAVLGAAEAAARGAQAGLVRGAAAWEALGGSWRRLAAQPRVQFAAQSVGACVLALAGAVVVMLALPAAVPCPRWTVVVRPFTSSPHFVPPRPFVDPAAPFNVSGLTIISGCTMSFMDRLENLVGSLQYWEPHTPIVLYDLGFTSEQLATLRCWRNVQVVRFPYEDYPPHVREISTYAFKPLVFQHALQRYPVMMWIDCGLEVRGPLDSLREVLSRNGHVSAQQSDTPADYSYTEKYQAPFFQLPDAEYQRIKNQPFCAAGVQGFVRGAASEQLVLAPTVSCAMNLNCMAPPGHSRANCLYEQTALTLNLRLHNYSSCMPRETHCTSAVKKLSWDPTASSAPIVMASRRPYQHRVASRPGCTPDPRTNPWRSVSSGHPETVAKSSSLLFKIGFVYGQAAGDFIIQASCCLGFHLLAQCGLLAALLAGEARRRLTLQRGGGLVLPSVSGGAPSSSGGGSCLAALCRPEPLLAGLLLLVLLMALSMGTSCKA
ncbi:exostoses (multiple)-like 2 [Pleodorina starrii]|nr:exostoses (multiple)-like 2 [Pleodorina starrii]